ncbi:MAG: class I SAM-dependent methyltransferase [Vicinamibacterales bacterium]
MENMGVTADGAVCRSCGGTDLCEVLSLGDTPLANALLTKSQLKAPEPCYPLDLVFCRVCSLVQITKTVPPADLFGEYLYFSSVSDTMVVHASKLVQRVIRERQLDGNSLAAEIASNDGYLLQAYKQARIPIVGVEPATNIAAVALEKDIPTVCDFFGSQLVDKLIEDYGRADVIHANNVLAHVPDLNGVVYGLRRFVKDSGVIIVEVPYVRDMVDGTEFDTVYHEHLCYFSVTALTRLFERHGLVIHDVERLNIHGGSLRIFSGIDDCAAKPSENVGQLLEQEAKENIDRSDFYLTFAERVEVLKVELVTLLRELRDAGKKVAAYGASAKGSTLLNYFGIDATVIEFVVDRSPVKQGRYTPGTHIPIREPEALLEERPDYVLLLTWNFEEEVLRQQEAYRREGGKFIVPIPTLRVV